LALVEVEGMRGYIDKTGIFVIQPKIADAHDFREGLAPIMVKGKLGYVDGTWGYIDKTGTLVIPAKFTTVRHFNEGLAYVEVGGPGGKTVGFGIGGYIDKRGDFVIPPVCDNRKMPPVYCKDFSEGLALIVETIAGKRGYGWEKGCGYVDRTGNLVIELKFEDAGSFRDGMAVVRVGEKWGYIDNTGKFVIQPRFDSAKSFQDGMAAVRIGGKWGYIDKTGKMLIEPFDAPFGIHSISEGLVAVRIGEKWGYIDKTGKFVIEPKFEAVMSFSEGLALVWWVE
jgi:hypothetical protein